MTIVFWASLLVVLYTYAGYPLLMSFLAKFSSRMTDRQPSARQVSVVMAVRNGGAILTEQLEALRQMPADVVREIIVVSDGSTDATVEILAQAAELMGGRLHTIALAEHGGKATALNHGIRVATSEILLFLDVRPRLTKGSLDELLESFADSRVGCVAGELRLQSAGQDATTSAVSGIYWKYEQWIRHSEAAWSSPVGVYGGYYAVRRELATPFPDGLILDDMFQPLWIVRKGYRSVIARNAIVVDRWPQDAAGEFRRKVRTLAGNYELIARQPWTVTPLNPVLFQFVSHKLLRLVVPYLLLLMLVSASVLAVHSKVWTALAVCQWIFWLLALSASRVRVPIVGKIASAASALLMLNAAVVAALWVYLAAKGPLFHIWGPTLVERQRPAGRQP